MSVNLSPIGNAFQFLTTGGLPLSAGLLWTYQAGTSTPLATYTDSGGGTPNANPIVLGPDGRLPNEVWLTSGSAYKLELMDSLSTPIATYDNISGINDFNNLVLAGNLTVNGNTILGNAAGDALTIYPNAITLVNNPTISGNLIWSGGATWSAAAPSFNFGGTFGNTARAGNTVLDWYEENNALSLSVTSTGGTPTGTATASFTRIGNRVILSIAFSVSSWGTSTGPVIFTGLTYPCVEDTLIFGAYAGTTTSINFTGLIASGTSQIAIKKLDGHNFAAADGITVWSGGLQGIYRV